MAQEASQNDVQAQAQIVGEEHEFTPIEEKRGHMRVKTAPANINLLREPITLPFSKRVAPNRLMKAPMTERLCHWNKEGEDISARGFPSREYLELYKRWGEGEIGIIVAGNTMVRYDAVEAFGNPIICDDHDGRIAKFREVSDAAKKNGSLFICQLSHPGRQGPKALNPNPVSASDVHLAKKWAGNEFAKPRPLEKDEIQEIVRNFGESAYLCQKAGFDGVQVHCAHGYLLSQFFSPSTNLRTDEYGGPFENRSRIVFEIIEEIRRRVPDPSFIICAKLNSVEFQDGGITSDDFKQLCASLEYAHVDFVDLSGGNFEARAFEHKKESTRKREAYFIEFAELIRPLLKHTKIFITGGVRSAAGMTNAIESGACDGIGFARPFAAEPYFAKEILNGRIGGAIECVLPLAMNTQAFGSQLHQIGRGDTTISDWSVTEECDRWKEAIEKETQRKISILPKVDSSGYAPIEVGAGFDFLK